MISVSVALALPGLQEVVDLRMEDGSTVQQALECSGLAQRYPQFDIAAAPVGIWSHACGRETLLRDGDRVEIYRPLQVDPKEMRRKRARL